MLMSAQAPRYHASLWDQGKDGWKIEEGSDKIFQDLEKVMVEGRKENEARRCKQSRLNPFMGVPGPQGVARGDAGNEKSH